MSRGVAADQAHLGGLVGRDRKLAIKPRSKAFSRPRISVENSWPAAAGQDASLRELMARMGHDSERAALLVAAGLGPLTEHALISLLALNGLRVSEASGANIEHLGLEHGHRTLTITRKGGEVVTICSRRALPGLSTWASGERTGAPVFLAADGAAAGPARHLHRRRLRRRRRPQTGVPAGKAPSGDLNRRTELPAAADARTRP